ncbi:MAG: nucleotidyltransferase family protein [Sulfurospirillum sp.]
MHTRRSLLSMLKRLKPKYEREGIVILGLFGSYAQNKQTPFSDIDIIYHLDYEKFSQKYQDGFSKLLRLDEIKQDLENQLKTRVDFVPDNNKALLQKALYV